MASETQLIIDNGANVELDGFSTAAPASVTLNNGNIINSSGTAATLTANVAFNLANGMIGTNITLAGTASLNKRTDGSVTIEGNYANIENLLNGGGIFVDNGALQYSNDRGAVPTSGPMVLYWCPTGTGTSAAWGDSDWCNSAGDAETWADGDVAVFDTSYANGFTTVVISGSVSPSEIEFDDDAFDITDDGGANSYILVPNSRSLNIYVASTYSATLDFAVEAQAYQVEDANGGPVTGDFTYGAGSLTKEGPGTLYVNSSNNNYWGGTYIDNGKVVIGSPYAFGNVNYSDSGLLAARILQAAPPIRIRAI